MDEDATDKSETGFKIFLGKPNAEDREAVGITPSPSPQDLQEENESAHITLSPLNPTALSDLLSRLPEPSNNADADEHEGGHHCEDATGFRGKSLAPPPKSGILVSAPFPPPPQQRAQQPFDPSLLPELPPAEQPAPPLSITSFAPAISEVDHALTSVSLTFSQPMVALSSISNVEAEAARLSISLTPQVDGKWRWLGAQTVQFEATHRLPFSTRFTLSVAPGCQSTIGGILRSAFSHTFSTSPPAVVQWQPSSTPKSLSPLFLLRFNQRVSPSSILSHIFLSAEADANLSPTFLGQDFALVEEAVAKEEWPQILEEVVAGTWVAFKLRDKPLQKSTSYVLGVPAGCPSAEGDLTSTKDWSVSFSTYGPLVLESSSSNSWYHGSMTQRPCWELAFSNQLDHLSVSKSVIHVFPTVQEIKISHAEGSSSVFLQPVVSPDTVYTVTLDLSVKDIYGQYLDPSKRTAEFRIGPAEQVEGYLSGPSNMIILDPLVLADPFVSLTVYNFSSLRIQVFQVNVDDWKSPDLPCAAYNNRMAYAEGKSCAVGKQVYDQEVELQVKRDEPYYHKLHLISLLQHQEEHLGQLLVIAEPTERARMQCRGISRPYRFRDRVCVWVQCTNLSVDAVVDQVAGSLTTWVTSLDSGTPVGRATVKIGSQKQDTAENGLAIVPMADGIQRNEMIVVQKGNDLTFMPDVQCSHRESDNYGWYVFDSRGLYKPTEEVHIKGYLRKLERKRGGGHYPVFARGRVKYTVLDASYCELTTGDAPMSEYGSFFFSFVIPENANLGVVTINLEYKGEQVPGCAYQHTVKVQEFRKPEFEVTACHWPSSVLYSHPSRSNFVVASTSAKYYSGEPLTGAEVRWTIQPSQTRYAPPGHIHYRFGNHNSLFPWRWGSYVSNDDSNAIFPPYELTGKMGTDGKHDVKIQFRGMEQCPSPISVSAHASVIDLNSQVQESATTFIVHPSILYVGFKLKEIFGRKGEDVKGEVIVCNVDGKLVRGVEVKLLISGEGKEEKEDDAGLLVHEDVKEEQEIALVSDEKPVEFSFTPRLGGVYCMVFSVLDEEQRCNRSRCNNFYIYGGYTAAPNRVTEFITQDKAQLIPNKDVYEAGETAVLLIQSPFWPAEGLISMGCSGAHVGESIRFRMLGNTHTVTVFLDASWIPTVDVQVLLVGSAPSTSPSTGADDSKQPLRPAFAVAQSSLEISASFHRLAVDITPMQEEETATPGGTIHVSVEVKSEKHGTAMPNAEISLIVVDEAILSLANYALRDPLSSFYPSRSCDFISHHLRKHCLMSDFHPTWRREFAFMKHEVMRCCAQSFGARSIMQSGLVDAIRTRSNFDPLAAFVSSHITDGMGLAELTVKLPDNLTRYRIWAVAATERQFGLAESSLTVQLPVSVRPSPPRFLNLSDEALLSVVLQNQTRHALSLLVGMRRNNARVDAASPGYSLTLPAFQRLAVSFSVLALRVGKARLQFVVSTSPEANAPSSFSDAVEVSVPIYAPVSSEFFATYGDVAETEVVLQPIKCPSDAFPSFGGLDVSISCTTLQSLTDALLYLYTYPFECNEQLASRIICISSLWEVLAAFNAKDMPSKENMRSKLAADLQMLKDRQLSCGGWSWWTGDSNADGEPFISLHVTCALMRASKMEVVDVDAEMLQKALGYCCEIETHLDKEAQGRSFSEATTKYALLAYALYVQAVSNINVEEQARALFQKASLAHLSLEACGWMLVALGLAKEKRDETELLLDHIKSRASETGEYAHFTTSYGDDGTSVMLHSDRRTDAILLEALLINEPSSPLCVKLAKGLQAHRTAGRWSSTQENCFVLLALNRFFAVFEKEEPNFTANVWMGEQWVASHTYAGRSMETKQATVRMPALLSEAKEGKGATQVVLQKKGEGRLYYRIGLGYAPRNFQQEAASYGFTISRVFEGLTSPLHAVHDSTTKVWRFRVGEKVRVKLTLGTTVNRYHVAMVDALPAGCEPLNPALAGVKQDSLGSSTCGRRRWWKHENMRDERVEAFCTLLRPGQYEYSYVLRATCKGEFVIPPAKVEEMYTPENFGRCGSERVVIH